MGLGDGADDREAEAEGATAVAGAADEALEQGVAQVLGHARAVVLDDQEGLTGAAAASVTTVDRGRYADLGAGGGMAERVLQQVDREAVQFVAGALDESGIHIERDLVRDR